MALPSIYTGTPVVKKRTLRTDIDIMKRVLKTEFSEEKIT